MNSNTAGPVDRAAPRMPSRRPTLGVVINIEEGVTGRRRVRRARQVHSVEAAGLAIDCVGS